ncbi:T9SS C-terminal target domain-containing protein [candidate division KSB1 bacterium]|nr:MAG: T9SS C-terminal target domain-containing protein [candidate division KSB1 bacterium]
MRRATLAIILLLLPLMTFASIRNAEIAARIVTATPERTVVTTEFDPSEVLTQLSSRELDQPSSDGRGVILAIAGRGAPVARILHVELADVVSSSSRLDESKIAANADELALLSEPAILHDLRIVSLNFRPLMRDENGAVRVVRRLDAEVVTGGFGGLNEQDDPVSFSSAFYPVYRTFVANLDELYPEISVRLPGRYLVVMTASRYTSIANSGQWRRWLDLKKGKGYTMQVSATLPNNASLAAVSQIIRQAYEDHSLPDLEYVVLFGDNNEIPSQDYLNPEDVEDRAVGDNTYFLLAGNDSLPDVLGGRISGSTQTEYVAYLNKVYRYEAEPYRASMDWFRSVCCVAGNFADGENPTYPVTPVWNVNWARERLLRDGCVTDADTFYYHSLADPPAPQYRPWIRNDINSGVCMVLYRGWAATQLWKCPEFKNEDVDQLTNGSRMPAVFAMVCGSGNFAFPGGPSLGEKFTTGSGSPSETKGAIIYIGASDLHTNTRHNNAMLSGIMEAILEGGVRSAGSLLLASKLEGWRQFPLERYPIAWYYVLHVFNLLGDPETQIYACLPGSMDVAYSQQTSVGTTLQYVNVFSDGQPLEGALVAIRKRGTDQVVAERTNAQGDVYLPVDFAAQDTADITVWKSGYFLNRGEILVQNQAFDPKITAVNWSAGADNLPNPGETANFTLTFRNEGSSATSYALSLASSDPRVTVITGTGTVSNLAPGESGTSSSMSVQLGTEMFDGERPRLAVIVNDDPHFGMRSFEMPVAAPDPSVVSLTVLDGGDGILSAGETAHISVTIKNNGHQNAENMTAIVATFDAAIEGWADNQTAWASVPVGETVLSDNTLNLTMAQGVTPGRQILFRFEFRQNNVVMARKHYLLPTGIVTPNTPTGPDAYGYWAYEDNDAGYAATPTYSWIELDPDFGGLGAETHEVRDDTHFGMRLPGTFIYYGQSYDSVWICSNGWLSFERAAIPEFRNWEIPSPIGPRAMVCPFWDDLIIDKAWPNDDSVHTVWTRWDAAESRFIVEWRAMNRGGLNSSGPNTAYCTFQAILEFHWNLDGDILFQYNQIANVDVDNNFGSVGIQDSYHERGLGLTYANQYIPSAAVLSANHAIRFTTTPPDNYSDVPDRPASDLPVRLALHEAYPNPFNPAAELRFDLPRAGRVALKIYDVLGQEVAVLVDGFQAAGSYRVSFDGRALPSGLYFARLASDQGVQVRKLMLVK